MPGTELRQADVLTSALGNALTALDVSICFPHAQEAGLDCSQSTVDSKLARYGPRLNTLLAQNIGRLPIVWSAYGRHHSNTLTVLRTLSKSISRRRNVATEPAVFRRLHAKITVEIWRREIRSCLVRG